MNLRRSSQRYLLIRLERLVVGPSTWPYPIVHETVLTSSDSMAELERLRADLLTAPRGRLAETIHPDNWIDALPGQKIFEYDVKRA